MPLDQIKYLNSLLYNGFYAFEMLSERILDDVICGICGTFGQVYYGDGNEKNCCSIDAVSQKIFKDCHVRYVCQCESCCHPKSLIDCSHCTLCKVCEANR